MKEKRSSDVLVDDAFVNLPQNDFESRTDPKCQSLFAESLKSERSKFNLD